MTEKDQAEARREAVGNVTPFNPLENADIGRRISARRKMLHMSQTQLAKAIGVSQTTMSEYENGIRPISAKGLRAVIGKLAAPIEYFLGDISLEMVARGDANYMMLESYEDLLGPDEIALLEAFGRLNQTDRAKAIRIVRALYDANEIDVEREILKKMAERAGIEPDEIEK